jgi:aspartate kinase
MLFVKKYGGSSVSTPEKILEIAHRLKFLHNEGHKLIVIISAMGDTTDELIGLSRRITLTPVQRELDMLMTSGERISMALMAIALNSLGCPAISFTGSQSGVFTDGSHNSARIVDIKAIRVKQELDKGRIVIIAGFQGVDPVTKEITTLGRGGSDTTAMAMAAAFDADRCDILTDVRGIFTVDPRIAGSTPHHFTRLDYETTMEMAYWGARVLHYRCVELAERTQTPLLVHLSSEEGKGTLIEPMEELDIQAVNYNSQIALLKFDTTFDLRSGLEAIGAGVSHGKQPLPHIVYQRTMPTGPEFFITAPQELFEGLLREIGEWCQRHGKKAPVLETHFATVSVTGRGLVNSAAAFEASKILAENKIGTEGLVITPLSVSFIIPLTQVQEAARTLHEKFCKP